MIGGRGNSRANAVDVYIEFFSPELRPGIAIEMPTNPLHLAPASLYYLYPFHISPVLPLRGSAPPPVRILSDGFCQSGLKPLILQHISHQAFACLRQTTVL